jgi:urea transport system ATP-binding protein
MSPTTRHLLYLDGVSVSFDGFKALNNLSLVVEPGEMRAIIGPNGAGKTTMMDVITGKTRPDDRRRLCSTARIDLTRLDEAAIAKLGIGRKFQKPTVFESPRSRGQSRARAQGRRASLRDAVLALASRRARAHRRDPRTIRLAGRARDLAGASATARSSGSRSACCWRRTPSCCWSTSRSPA